MEIVLAHPPTFDGLAAAAAARRLRPGSALVVAGALSGRVGEFAALHGEACGLLGLPPDLDRVSQVWHVSGSSPPRPPNVPPQAVWGTLAGTGGGTATTTGYVLELARVGAPVSPMEATLFYLGILEGSRGYPEMADVEALLYCLQAGARREVAAPLLGMPFYGVGPPGGAHWLPDPQARAADLMSRPVQAVGPDTAIAEAHSLLLRTGHGVLAVAGADDRPVGLLTRTDLERAVRHGLGDRPAREAMSPDPPAVGPGTPVGELIGLLVGPGPGRVLVVDRDRLVGIIARSDVLSRLYDRATAPMPGAQAHPPDRPAVWAGPARTEPERARRKHTTPGPPGRLEAFAGPEGPYERRRRPRGATLDAAALLEDRWALDKLALLRRISLAAAGQRVYLVGGAVRDLLLGRPSYDIDLMLEEEGQAFARHLAAEVGAGISVHLPFGTATLTLPDGLRLDVATSRAELYVRPGALPDVAPAGLVQDLARRDFTVNALAMRVDPEAWGQVVDPFGGLADVRSRRLRILHNLSFVEDPTRLVRGIRFERTLDMRLEPVTEGFARYAMATGRLDGLGGERLKAELRKLLALPAGSASAARMADLDGWRLLDGQLAGQPVDRPALDRLESSIADWPALRADERAAARFRGVLAVILSRLEPEPARRALAGLHPSADDLHAISQAIGAGRELLGERSWADGRPSDRFARLRHLGPVALRHLAAMAEDPAVHEAIADHLGQRAVRLAGVDGTWLKDQGLPPGPLFGRVLTETLAAVLDGTIAGVEAERAFALHRARELMGEER